MPKTQIHVQRSENEPVQRQTDLPTIDGSESLSSAQNQIIKKFLDLESLTDQEITSVKDIFGIDDGDEIRKSEDRLQWIQTNHETVTRLLSGAEASQEGRYPDWYDPPHKLDSLVIEFVSEIQEQQEVELLRAHVDDNQDGFWLIPPETLGGLDPEHVDDVTADELQNGLALPERPKYLSKVTIPAKTPMRISTIKENFGSEGGWPQIELENRLGKDAYEVVRTFEETSPETEVNTE